MSRNLILPLAGLLLTLAACTDSGEPTVADNPALAKPVPEGMERGRRSARLRDAHWQAPGSRRCRPGPRTACRGLYLAGAWTDTGWPATMEGAVRSGVAAARAVVDDVGHGTAAHAARAA